MTTPLMFEAFVVLPKTVAYIVLLGLLIAGISERRQRHIGRIGIFLNALFLWQIFYSTFKELPVFFQWYLNIGSVVGLIALLAYLSRESLSKKFYQFCYIGYSSLSVLFIMMIWLLDLIK